MNKTNLETLLTLSSGKMVTDYSLHKLNLAISTLTEALEFVSSKKNEYERLGYAKAAISLALSDLQAITTQVEQ